MNLLIPSIIILVSISGVFSHITGPIESTDGIRLSPRKMKGTSSSTLSSIDHKPGSAPQHHNSQDRAGNVYSASSTRGINLDPTNHHKQQRRYAVDGDSIDERLTPVTQQHKNLKPINSTKAKLKILEPPMDSFIFGGNFHVAIQIQPDNEYNFNEAYKTSGKICISLDESPWHCWPAIGGRIHFAESMEGSHSVIAKLWLDGEMIEDSVSDRVKFTTVDDPDLFDDISKTETGTSARSSVEETEEVTIDVPIVQLLSPADHVTYLGTSILLRTNLSPIDQVLFKKLFKYAFVCINIDVASAHACFPIFGDNSPPFILGLGPGMHTITSSLSHPETKQGLIHESDSGIKTFYMAGDDNVAAAVVIKVLVDGTEHQIPIHQTMELKAQSTAFCASIGMRDSNECNESIMKQFQIELGANKGWEHNN